ncbi:hypothetical protein K469DRAFT_358292 [Zopfia rhizophila CBS 207.26]|uniref:Uncharacterized protein n=1 Tax=Zopfia rhizophila CBS 207.26 TaxID=1314779 RepID=A0A6A6DGE8_9PEZI|nr:hypothetical protein K469DRAFT_358292 [Zopfia rhizophila CBS 207.26]
MAPSKAKKKPTNPQKSTSKAPRQPASPTPSSMSRKRSSTVNQLPRLSKRTRAPTAKALESQQPQPPAPLCQPPTPPAQFEPEPTPLLKFQSIWRVVLGKETLPVTEAGVYEEGAITIRQLEAWRDEKLLFLKPRRLTAVRWCTNASYSGCKSTEECPYIIASDLDLYKATQVLSLWREQYPKKTLRLDLSFYVEEEAPVIDLTIP